MWRRYGKAIVALLTALVMAGLTVVREANADAVIDAQEWVLVVIAVFQVLTVWGAANIPRFSEAKTFMAAIMVVLNLLVSYIVGGITGDEWMLLIINFIGTIGVAFAPAVSDSPGARPTLGGPATPAP